MNTDFRLSTGLTTHPKTIKLMRRCGDRAFFCLINLWGWAAQYKPDGDLSGMDDEAIEIAADWLGEVGALVAQLVAVGFVDGGPGAYRLHDWCDHNPWACGAEKRADEGRLNKLAGKFSDQVKELKKTGVTGISKEEYKELSEKWLLEYRSSEAQAPPKHPQSNPSAPCPTPTPTPTPTPSPSPSPSPTPTPNVVVGGGGPPAPDDRFSMHADWMPSEYFATLAMIAGVVPPTGEDLETALQEFIPFWMSQKRRCTAHEWDLAFVKAIKSGFTAPKKRSGPRPQTLTPRQQYMQDVGNMLEAMDAAVGNDGRTTSIGKIVDPLPGIRPQLEHPGAAGV